MLKLSTSYSKKIPVNGQDYSSQQFHASVELELSDALKPEEIKARIHDTFATVKAAVEDELNGNGVKTTAPAVVTAQGQPAAKPASTTDKASNKQIKFITDLATQRGVTLADLDGEVRNTFAVGGLYELSRRQASQMVDILRGSKRKAA